MKMYSNNFDADCWGTVGLLELPVLFSEGIIYEKIQAFCIGYMFCYPDVFIYILQGRKERKENSQS